MLLVSASVGNATSIKNLLDIMRIKRRLSVLQVFRYNDIFRNFPTISLYPEFGYNDIPFNDIILTHPWRIVKWGFHSITSPYNVQY